MNSKGEPTTREELRAAREAAWQKVADRWEAATDSYPIGHAVRRDAFVRRESEKAAKEIEDRQLQVIPDADKDLLRRRRR